MSKPSKPQKRKTVRIYYNDGEHGDWMWWDVPVANATQPVVINGTLADALAGKPGVTIGCHLSRAAMRNASAFPHSVKYASFTQNRCIIIDKIKHGKPWHCIRYEHGYGRLVNLNDTDKKKTFIKNNPHLAERAFTLKPPRETPPRGESYILPVRKPHTTRHKMPRGALRRAIEAGLITAVLDGSHA